METPLLQGISLDLLPLDAVKNSLMNSHSRVPRSLRLFDPVREIIRRKHYSARAVRAYLYWGPVVGMFPVNRDAQRVIEFDCLMSK